MLRDFSDTVAFVKVVQEGSFTAAARILKVPKTRISRKVQELEQSLQAQLLNRTTRSLKLTEVGAAYFQRCEAIVKDLEDAENAVAELQDHPRGWLRLTAPFWLGTRVIAPMLSETGVRAANVSLCRPMTRGSGALGPIARPCAPGHE
ncbi:MAG TPA: LysR family transcriptional regulator [Allosphingosinicella sp.]|nr:LysR family transcriptional regulator [Allosphingosinicella sp.]